MKTSIIRRSLIAVAAVATLGFAAAEAEARVIVKAGKGPARVVVKTTPRRVVVRTPVVTVVRAEPVQKVWVPGHWVKKPGRRAVWVAGHWVKV